MYPRQVAPKAFPYADEQTEGEKEAAAARRRLIITTGTTTNLN